MTKEIKQRAKRAYGVNNYLEAFNTLLDVGIVEFLKYAQKEDKRSKKTNWLTDKNSGRDFFREFITTPDVFSLFFERKEVANQILHVYFSNSDFFNEVLEKRAAKEFAEIYVESVRVNFAFLCDDRGDFRIKDIELDREWEVHKEVWKELNAIEKKLWRRIENSLTDVANYSLSEILTCCVVWFEEKWFKKPDKLDAEYLAHTYSFFIELILSVYPDKFIAIDSQGFHKDFRANFYNSESDKHPVSVLLNGIRTWGDFYYKVLLAYCHDLSTYPVFKNKILWLQNNPESFYHYLADGIRYDFNHIYYHNYSEIVIEHQNYRKAVNTASKECGELFANLVARVLFLEDLCIRNLCFKGIEVSAMDLLQVIVEDSFYRKVQYYEELERYKNNSKNWKENYECFMSSSSNKPMVLPYVLMKVEDYKGLNEKYMREGLPNMTKELVGLFSFRVGKKSGFKRFDLKYDVRYKPFLLVKESLFCPITFFANNDWFYTAALVGVKNNGRKGGRDLEKLLAKEFECNGFDVKNVSQGEAGKMKGDVDLIVWDNDRTILMQIKRTHFRGDQKDAYFEKMIVEKKAMEQLNEAEAFLRRNNPVFNPKGEIVKWFVSTSFERVGVEDNSIRKVNFFDILHVLRSQGKMNLQEFVQYIENDRILKDFSKIIYLIECHEDSLLGDLGVFENEICPKIPISNLTEDYLDYERIYDKGIQHDQEGKKEEAILIFESLLQREPNDEKVLMAMANIYADLKDYRNSFINFSKVLELLPNDPFILRNYALALKEAGAIYEADMLWQIRAIKFPLLNS